MAPSMTKNLKITAVILVVFGAPLWFYKRASEKHEKQLNEFIADHISKIISDPKVQESIKVSAATFT